MALTKKDLEHLIGRGIKAFYHGEEYVARGEVQAVSDTAVIFKDGSVIEIGKFDRARMGLTKQDIERQIGAGKMEFYSGGKLVARGKIQSVSDTATFFEDGGMIEIGKFDKMIKPRELVRGPPPRVIGAGTTGNY